MYSLKFLLVGIFLLVVGIAFQVDVILATASHNDFGQLFQLQQALAPFLRRTLDIPKGASVMATGLSTRHVPPRNGLLPVLILTLVGLLVGCGASTSHP